MKVLIQLVAAGILSSLLCASPALAQLSLSGKLYGDFSPLAPGDRGFGSTTIINLPTGSVFKSGAPYMGGGQTTLEFTHQLFTEVGHGGTIAVDFLHLFNASTLAGTTAESASLDLMIDLSQPDLAPFKLTTVTFGIDNTLNVNGAGVPDLFHFTFPPVGQVQIADTLVKFQLSFPATFGTFPGQEVGERASATTGLITLSFTSIPEPSSYGMLAAGLLCTLAMCRRTRRPHAGPRAIARMG